MRSVVQPLFGALLLALVVVVGYGPTLSHGFVWDDHEQIVDNQALRSWTSLDDFFATDVLGSSRADGERSNYYRPLFFTHALAYFQAFGLDARAWHAMALLWHLAASCAAWLLLRRLGLEPATAWTAAALFALHPAHGESVSWLAAAFNDPPATTAILLGLAAHLRWARSGAMIGLAGGLLGFTVALLHKEAALAMLLLVPLVEIHGRAERARGGGLAVATLTGIAAVVAAGATVADAFGSAGAVAASQATALVGAAALAFARLRRQEDRRLVVGLTAYGVVTVAYFFVRKLAIATSFGVYTGGFDLPTVAATAPRLALLYLRLLVWPWHFAPTYAVRPANGWADVSVWLSLGVLAILSALSWIGLARLRRRAPVAARWVVFGLIWIAASAWPAFNIASFRPAYLAHQRYLYLAALGLCATLAVWAAGRPRRLAALGGLAGLWIASLWVHNPAWSTDVALWTRIAEVDPANPAAFDWLGSHHLKAGDLDTAERLFRRSITVDPEAPFGHRNLAILMHQHRRRPAEALPSYRRALAAFTRRPDQRAAAVRAAVDYGVALAETGDTARALEVLLPLAEQPPHSAQAAANAAVLLRQLGERDRLDALLRKSVERHPDDLRLRRMLDALRAESP